MSFAIYLSKTSHPHKPETNLTMTTISSETQAFSTARQSWDSGGTDHILPMERKKATFSIEKMTNILDGGEEFTRKRRWIQNSHDDAFEDEGKEKRVGQVEVHADMSRSKVVAQSMSHFMDVHWEHLERGYRPVGQDMTFMSGTFFVLAIIYF